MGTYSAVPADVFNDMQFEAGTIVKNFDEEKLTFEKSDIVCATTGDITVNCTPTYEDFFADINNMPNDTKEGKRITGWSCTLAFTAVGISPEALRMYLGAADINAANAKIIPRSQIKTTDFTDKLYWIGDRGENGVAWAKLINALSTGGFSLRTTKNGKGQVSVTMTGHVSVEDTSVVPMELGMVTPGAETVETPGEETPGTGA